MATSYSFPGFSALRPERYTTPPPPSRDQIEREISPTPETFTSYANRSHPPQYDLSAKGLGVTLGYSMEQNSHDRVFLSNHPSTTSPIFTQHSSPVTFTNDTSQVTLGFDNNGSCHEQRAYRNRKNTKGHTRSGSTIDTLATIALATSPAEYHSPIAHSHEFHSSGTIATQDERPAKRARSEKLPSPILNRSDARPATSYVQSNIVTNIPSREDAELLLNLSKGTRFSPVQNSRKTTNVQSPISPQLMMPSVAGQTSPSAATQAISHHEPEAPPLYQTSDSVHAPAEASVSPTDHQPIGVTPPHSNEALTETPPTSLTEDTSGHVSLSGEAHNIKDKGVEQNSEDVQTQEQATAPDEQGLAGTPAPEPSPDKIPSRASKRKASAQVSQALCAKCNQAQITVAGEDQDVNCWIGCESCKQWFHYACAGFKDEREVRTVDKFFCHDCEKAHGPTTYVRKSSRARTAIDYAGLNQGMVQSSADTPDHSYIKPIKDGRITFLPDNFARMRPEDVTADFFQKTLHGMPRPIVIPAEWNPRPEVEAYPTGTLDDGEELVEFMPEDDGSMGETEDLGLISDVDQDRLDMIMPRKLTVRKVAELYGPEEKLDVIDVKSQQADKRWTLAKWADYYESKGEKAVRNVISLEISQSTLGRLIRRPKIVRDLDLQDSVWPADLQALGDFPKVQFYCLMSVADCYTDFHIDFGGSSVYYHILKGKKTFFFIPPKEAFLKKYTEWCNSPSQGTTFLGDETGECMRVDLSEGDTMLIPSGWIHAVWTPEDSLVIGGNFLTRLNYEMQIKINQIERDTHTALKFRYPFFQKVNWYAAIQYLMRDPIPQELVDKFYENKRYIFTRTRKVYEEIEDVEHVEPGSLRYNERYYSQKEIEGLPALRDFLYRTARIAAGDPMDGVTADTKRAVTRSVPKSFGDPMHLIKTFAMWCAWKIGDVEAPPWVRSDTKPVVPEKKDKSKKPETHRLPGERQSSRVQSQQRSQSKPNNSDEDVKKAQTTSKSSSFGSRRIACDACRKRRIRCHHKEEDDSSPTSPEATRSNPGDSSSVRVEILQSSTSSMGGLDGTDEPSAATDDAAPYWTSGIPFNDSDPITPAPAQRHSAVQPPPSTSSTGKRARTKACDSCRKSKRRCTHDEYGNVDPKKEAEPSRPRGSGTAKRTANASTDNTSAHPKKKAKREAEARRGSAASSILVDTTRSNLFSNTGRRESSTYQVDDTSLIDPALIAESASAPTYTPEMHAPYQSDNCLHPNISEHYFTRPTDEASHIDHGIAPTTEILHEPQHPAPVDGVHTSYQGPQEALSGSTGTHTPPENFLIDPTLQTMAVSALGQAHQPSPSLEPQKEPSLASPSVQQPHQAQQHPSLTVQTELTVSSSSTALSADNHHASMVSPPNSSLQDSDPQMSPNIDMGFEVTDSIEIAHDSENNIDHANNSLHTPRSASISHSQKSRTKSPRTIKIGSNEANPDTESMELIQKIQASEFSLRRRSSKV
ncbi:MAG: hypothetical protein Q9160_002760 [Pyrenula sp. 1 TL-2023]